MRDASRRLLVVRLQYFRCPDYVPSSVRRSALNSSISSFPRRRESSSFDHLDSRLRGNDVLAQSVLHPSIREISPPTRRLLSKVHNQVIRFTGVGLTKTTYFKYSLDGKNIFLLVPAPQSIHPNTSGKHNHSKILLQPMVSAAASTSPPNRSAITIEVKNVGMAASMIAAL